jgi:mono/diheme cytochrome c family protein
MALDRKTIIILIIAVTLGLAVNWFFNGLVPDADKSAVAEPKLSDVQAAGKTLFEQNCMACHGPSGGGSKQGPPLIHKYYEPSHHGDEAFIWVAKKGVRAHHWNFGDMPQVNGVNDSDVQKIIQYIRAVQRENGVS